MNTSFETNKYRKIYNDFLHPNPNINSKAAFCMREEFSSEFMIDLLNNLKNEDVQLRRKSILALGEFDLEVFKPIIELYLSNTDKNLKVSCLKTILKVVVNKNIEKLEPSTMVIINMAIKDTSPEITLIVISLLRQLGIQGKNILMKTCRDKDLLRAKASVTALLEMDYDRDVDKIMKELLNDELTDIMIKEDIINSRDYMKN